MARVTPELTGKSGLVGTMNQVGIVTGLLSAQLAGLALTGSVSGHLCLYTGYRAEADCQKGDIPGSWRYVVAIPGLVSVLQIAVASRIPDPAVEGYHPAPSSGAAEDPEAIFDASQIERDEGELNI